MAIVAVQTVTGTGNLTLNGVAAGNLLIAWQSIFRATSTQAAVGTPTDSVGANFSVAIAGVPAFLFSSSWDVGVGIFYKQNAESGTHTVTPEAASNDHGTLSEFSGMSTTGALDVSIAAKTENTSHTSRTTGTTGTTAQADELICIGHSLGGFNGAVDVGYTDPVSGFTTVQKVINDASDLAMFHAYKIASATGTQSATFNWTATETTISSHAAIATFKGTAAGGVAARASRYRPFPYKPGSPQGLR